MFDFKLQKVLDYRENLEKEIKEDFSLKLSVLNKEKLELDKLLQEKEKVKNKTYKEALKTANDLIIYQRYVDYLEKTIENKINSLKEAEKELELVRLNLINATKDKKIIEILKESAFEEYLSEENLIEQKNLDDIALRTYINSLEGGE